MHQPNPAQPHAAPQDLAPQDWKIGVDICGTFMDFCALETVSGRITSLKVLTTPDDPGAELHEGLRRLSARDGLDPQRVSRFVHGTTVGINTILQRKGARLALITNAGFEDVIALARLRMPEMYSLFCHRAEPLIGREMLFGIPARMGADGVARAGGASGVIVALLHAWRDAAQKAAVARMVAQAAPELFVFTSAEVWPMIREYERFSTAILNGYVYPRVAGYLEALEARLSALNVPARALLTRSNGGLMDARQGRRDCVSMLLSGTASGVMGAAYLARQAGENRILALDIGGTSADFALIIDGAPQFGTGEMIGDFPLYIPSVSVSSIGIGIGGGSVAQVDAQGALRIEADLARAALEPLAEALGRGLLETAQAILEIAVSEMFVEASTLASRAGVDLRDFALMPFGGGGPMLGAIWPRNSATSAASA